MKTVSCSSSYSWLQFYGHGLSIWKWPQAGFTVSAFFFKESMLNWHSNAPSSLPGRSEALNLPSNTKSRAKFKTPKQQQQQQQKQQQIKRRRHSFCNNSKYALSACFLRSSPHQNPNRDSLITRWGKDTPREISAAPVSLRPGQSTQNDKNASV